MAEMIADRSPALGPVFEWTWKILQWPLVFALASTGIALIYYFAPDVEQDWIWLTPGSVFATTVWLIASLGFKYYVANMGAYVETYGAIGGVMVLLLWFYLSGLAILIGAEMNAEIEHASPYGKDEGEKVPGQKRKIGSKVMRTWIAKRRQRGEKPPSAEEVKDAVGPTPPDKEPGAADAGIGDRQGSHTGIRQGIGADAGRRAGAGDGIRPHQEAQRPRLPHRRCCRRRAGVVRVHVAEKAAHVNRAGRAGARAGRASRAGRISRTCCPTPGPTRPDPARTRPSSSPTRLIPAYSLRSFTRLTA